MKKKILLIILVLFLCASSGLFAISITYGNAHQNVDLSNQSISDYQCLQNHGSMTPSYYDSSQVLARISIDPSNDLGQDITIEFPDGLNYVYEGSSRPYGVELVYKTKLKVIGEEQKTSVVGYKSLGHSEIGETSAQFRILSAEDISNMEDSALSDSYPGWYSLFEFLYKWVGGWIWYDSIADMMRDILFGGGKDSGIIEAYIDIVLVLEEDDSPMIYAPSNEYTDTINIISEKEAQKEVPISGYFTDIVNRITCNLNVSGTDNAETIDLNEDFESIKNTSSSGLEVGRYDYEFILTGLSQIGFSAFLSSNSNPTSPDPGKFSLENANYSFGYQAGISAENSDPVWFDGDMTLADVNNNETTGNDFLFNFGISDFTKEDNSLKYSGHGKILFRLTEESTNNIANIPPGTYTSTIYFHVVADL